MNKPSEEEAKNAAALEALPACKEQPSQVKRDSSGRWKRGQSGNPSGRPQGATSKLLALAREGALELWPKIMELARTGDMEAVKMVLACGIPKSKPVAEIEPLPTFPAEDSLTAQAKEVLRAAASGELSTDAAAALVAMLGTAARIDEISQLREQVEALRRLLEKRS